METTAVKPSRAPQDLFFLVDAAGVPAEPQAFHHKICEGIEDRKKFEVHLDNGGPNRQDPAAQDPPALLITIAGRRWKISVPELAKEIIQTSWATGQKS